MAKNQKRTSVKSKRHKEKPWMARKAFVSKVLNTRCMSKVQVGQIPVCDSCRKQDGCTEYQGYKWDREQGVTTW